MIITFFFMACQSNREDREAEDKSLQEQKADADPHALDEAKTLTLPYIVVADTETAAIEIEENPQRSKVPLNKEELLEALNIKYPDIDLKLGASSHDTLQVNIDDATFLTQQYGTTGALTYLAEATYAFTELPDIKVVNFNFKEGDHAVPGPYTRDSFRKSL
ncbi:hypothetical protein H8S90_25320 [Olivibacter sp. SDN3]|uniref:hypothetical protein n=1 Tax=Olivibacter sp. SDN3 TaxID=2764720 RepID=UPI001650E940|nr:hypothetical protein [Olivibacter sp. SDN3]QNL49965.1 hypothetical protein H8S90_25320 [Olivibacter sp. SDN3]